MKLPGNNEIILCQQALCEIFIEHLKSKMYSNADKIRIDGCVLNVHTVTFKITTDAKE